MNIKYAVFDMDGTLLDTMYYWRNIYRFYAEFNGLSNPEISEEILQKTESMQTLNAIDYLKQHYSSEAIQSIDINTVFQVIEQCYKQSSPLRKGVLDTLTAMKNKGIKMCVASATLTKQVKIALAKAGISDFFDFILTPDDYPKGKADKDIFYGAAKRFGCNITDLVLFEDALYSMKVAKSLGIKVVAIKEKYELWHLDEIEKYSDIVLNDFTELNI